MEGSILCFEMREESPDEIRFLIGSQAGKIYSHLLNLKEKEAPNLMFVEYLEVVSSDHFPRD